MDQLLKDIRFGFRMIRISPGFTAAAILMLALGIGATTAIFSFVDAVGLVIGLLGALGLTRLLSGLLFGVSPRDPWTLLLVGAILAAAAAAACYIPAQRAARVDPLIALRHE